MPKNKFKETEIGMIPEDWAFEELGKHAKIMMGQSPESIYYNSEGKGTLFLQGVRTFGIIYPKYDTWTTKVIKLAKKHCILLSVRAPVGEVNMADNDICIGRGLMSIEGKNNEFIFYLFKTFKWYVISKETGTVYGSVTRDDITKLKFPFPNDIEQSAIAKILSSLDSKIELNQQMNKTLEAIGQALFKHWFVDFEFPNEEGKPYKSSGGEMIDSELGKIPKGWRVGKIGEEVIIKGGSTPSTENSEYWNGELHWCTPKDLSKLAFPVLLKTERKITKEGLDNIASGLLPKNSLLLSSRAPIGYLAISQIETAINQGFIGIICNKRLSSMFMLWWVKNNLDIIKNMANGSTFLEINKSNFRTIEIIIPETEILHIFDIIVSSLFNKVVKNEKESQNLSQIRDLLLPRLMSGKIRVPVEVRR